MSYAGVQMLMEKLNHLLINSNHIPFFNYPEIIIQRPQFQLLYQDLASFTQTLFNFIHQHHHHLEAKINHLMRRFTDAAEEAQYILDLFLSDVHISRNNRLDSPTSEDFDSSLNLNLDDVRLSLMFIKAELKSMRIDSMKMDSSPLNQSVAAQSSISRGSKKLLDETFVGIDGDAELIRDKLVEDQKKVDVVSIVGMGGIGKTTLATKVFNDGFVKYHFHVRVWVTVSQSYDKRAVLTQILESIRAQLHEEVDLENAADSKLRELVHKNLMGKRYLIVIDDIWHTETWDSIKVFFPHDNNGSRILLTSRLTEVAKHANSDGLIHHLGYLNKERSWELFCRKVFHDNECPEWSTESGMQIVENCKGLPLAVVVIAGVLAKEALSEKFWMEIALKTSSYIVGDENGCLKTLALSYNHLPLHLRECFLYFGGFPEDHKFKVKRLIRLWVAEGFIQQDGNRSLEDVAEGYLMDLIDRNLVIVDGWKSNGGVKACKVHDLIMELCLEKAKEERFILQTEKRVLSPQLSNKLTPPYKPVRLFIDKESIDPYFPYPASQNLRTILCFPIFEYSGDAIQNFCYSFVLLRVLDLQNCRTILFYEGIKLLVHLRYLAIWNAFKATFPSSICSLWSLQTLIYLTDIATIVLPSNISDLVNLRHLLIYHPTSGSMKPSFYLPSIERPMNLQTFSNVKLGDGVDNFQNCFPYVKELTFTTTSEKKYDFKSLACLEKLELIGEFGRKLERITFPATLKSLTLTKSRLPWSEMSIIQSLPNLQVLKLSDSSFVAGSWNTDGQEFQQLKFLRLEYLYIRRWEAYSRSFPCLRQLDFVRIELLEEIPLEIGDIPTLEHIKIERCPESVGESVRRIQEEQHDCGNYDLKIDIISYESYRKSLRSFHKT